MMGRESHRKVLFDDVAHGGWPRTWKALLSQLGEVATYYIITAATTTLSTELKQYQTKMNNLFPKDARIGIE